MAQLEHSIRRSESPRAPSAVPAAEGRVANYPEGQVEAVDVINTKTLRGDAQVPFLRERNYATTLENPPKISSAVAGRKCGSGAPTSSPAPRS